MAPQGSLSAVPPPSVAFTPAPQVSASPVALGPQNVVGFTVEQGGVIRKMPTRFSVGSHELVHWLIGNKSGASITVRLENFLRETTPVVPLAFLVSDEVEIQPGKIGSIAAIKHPDYEQQTLIDRVKYTIRVVGASPQPQIYDPDGDIKP